MGIIRDRQIDTALREVDAISTLLNALNISLTSLEERVKALENDRQRSTSSGNRGRPRKLIRD